MRPGGREGSSRHYPAGRCRRATRRALFSARRFRSPRRCARPSRNARQSRDASKDTPGYPRDSRLTKYSEHGNSKRRDHTESLEIRKSGVLPIGVADGFGPERFIRLYGERAPRSWPDSNAAATASPPPAGENLLRNRDAKKRGYPQSRPIFCGVILFGQASYSRRIVAKQGAAIRPIGTIPEQCIGEKCEELVARRKGAGISPIGGSCVPPISRIERPR